MCLWPIPPPARGPGRRDPRRRPQLFWHELNFDIEHLFKKEYNDKYAMYLKIINKLYYDDYVSPTLTWFHTTSNTFGLWIEPFYVWLMR